MINNETNVWAFDKSLTGWRNICEQRLWDTVESQNITNNKVHNLPAMFLEVRE